MHDTQDRTSMKVWYRFLPIVVMILLAFTFSVPPTARALEIVSWVDGRFYFQHGGIDVGSWRHTVPSTGEIAYCLNANIDPPVGDCPIPFQPSDGLCNLLLHGFPATQRYGSLDSDEWRMSTQMAIWIAMGQKDRTRLTAQDSELLAAVDYLLADYAKGTGEQLCIDSPSGHEALPEVFDADDSLWRCGPYAVRCDSGVSSIDATIAVAPEGSFIGDSHGNAKRNLISGESFYLYMPALKVADSSRVEHQPSATFNVTALGIKPAYVCWRSVESGFQNMVVASVTPEPVSVPLSVEWGELVVTKTSEDGIDLAREFLLSGPSGDIPFRTDENGSWHSGALPSGTYTVTELDTPARYTPTEPLCIEVVAGTTTTCTFSNTLKRGSIELTKKSWIEGDATSFTFLIESITSGYRETVHLRADEPLIIDDLLCGTYTITEIDVDETTYIESEPICVELTNDTVAQVHKVLIENKEAMPKIFIEKIAEDTTDVGGTAFEVSSDKGWCEIVTIPDGKSSVEVALPTKGCYTVKEIDVDSRYLTPGTQTIEATRGSVYTLTFENRLKPDTIPKLGDDSALSLVGFILLLSAAYIVLGSLLVRRREARCIEKRIR
ncbi:MAG: Cys-Gln thioester bond-forming surface protein [Actinobacteria bacterium]|nr:Cys-Gln thioester bond-forming surface protein [Actinomycetota bacterium]